MIGVRNITLPVIGNVIQLNCRQEVTSLSSGAFSLVYLLLNISDFRSIGHAQIMTHREKNVNIVKFGGTQQKVSQQPNCGG